jgi:GxxExxY protein
MHQNDDLIEGDLVYSIIGAFYDVYNYYGYGLLEGVYVAALHQELLDRGHRVDREVRLPILYKQRRVGWHRADMIVDGKVIVECKAADALPPYAQRQILSYLNATPLEVGVLLHFGPEAKYHRYVDTVRNRRRGPYKQRS